MPDLKDALARAEGSEMLPRIYLGGMNAETACRLALARIEEMEIENARLRDVLGQVRDYHQRYSDRSTLIGGDFNTLTSGDDSILIGGDRSVLTGGDGSTLISGHDSNLTAGEYSTLIGGDGSILTGGCGSILLLFHWDGNCRRMVVLYPGENGIEPGVAYRLDETGTPLRVSAV